MRASDDFLIPSQEILQYNTQQVLSEQLNLPLRILRWDAFSRIEKQYGKKQLKQLLAICRSAEDPSPFRIIDSPMRELLAPDTNTPQMKTLAGCLWVTPWSAPNPFFSELRRYFPQLRAYFNLHYLRGLSMLRSDESLKYLRLRHLASGFYEFLIPYRPRFDGTSWEGVVVAGPCWCSLDEHHEESDAELSTASKSSFLVLEQSIDSALQKLEKISGHFLDTEQKISLLVLSASYLTLSSDHLKAKGDMVVRTLEEVLKLRVHGVDGNPKVTGDIAAAQWTRVIQWILFWTSFRKDSFIMGNLSSFKDSAAMAVPTPSLLQDIFRQKKAQSVPSSIVIETLLAGPWKEPRLTIQLVLEAGPREPFTIQNSEFRMAIHQGQRHPGEVLFFSGRGFQLSQDVRKEIQLLYLQFQEQGRLNRARQDYLAFDRLRLILQQLPFEEIKQRSFLIVRRARRLLRADVAAFFEYDSLNNLLRRDNVWTAPWLPEANLDFLDQQLVRLSTDNDERSKSAVYRCLDSDCMQSRFRVSDRTRPFGEEIETEVRHLPLDADMWGCEAQDFMAVPVQFHERILGVLYLVAATPFRFSYKDRNRLLTFIHAFEQEMFEARLFTTLRDMNRTLGRALSRDHGATARTDFCNRLMEQLGRLLVVAGAGLWWRSGGARDHFELWGLAGSEVQSIFKVGQEFPISAAPFDFAVSRDEDKERPYNEEWGSPKLRARFERLGMKGMLCLPLIEIEKGTVTGIVTLHDRKVITLSAALIGELIFIGQELQQNLAEYNEHRQRVEAMQRVVAHDIEAALRSIDSSTIRLSELGVFFESSSHARQLELRIEDIRKHADMAKRLLDWLTNDKIQQEIQLRKGDPLIEYYHQLNDSPFIRQTTVRRVVNDVVKPRTPDFNDKGIRPDHQGRVLPKLWVREEAIREVFLNLVDNVVKYGIRGSAFILTDDQDDLEYFYFLESKGVPLRDDVKESPDVIFQQGKRGVPLHLDGSRGGKGEGLHVARLITKSWGGELTLEYSHDQEAALYRFCISFPRWLASEENPWS